MIKSGLDFLVWECWGSNWLWPTWSSFVRSQAFTNLSLYLNLFLEPHVPQGSWNGLLPHWALLFLSFLSYIPSVPGHYHLVLLTIIILMIFLHKETISSLRSRASCLLYLYKDPSAIEATCHHAPRLKEHFLKSRALCTFHLPHSMLVVTKVRSVKPNIHSHL